MSQNPSLVLDHFKDAISKKQKKEEKKDPFLSLKKKRIYKVHIHSGTRKPVVFSISVLKRVMVYKVQL